ncbi:hypothetical protein [uncultured Pseudoteredinibacter sp.]|uniref:hypothetical protein n=1 Tax=uncultured Pseudoteredinibacter sp. TaxID=1641701 RepID=UPI0026305E32|nr:hypothetical protein [uncultured Pseudoteredinibacter sp.]
MAKKSIKKPRPIEKSLNGQASEIGGGSCSQAQSPIGRKICDAGGISANTKPQRIFFHIKIAAAAAQKIWMSAYSAICIKLNELAPFCSIKDSSV